MSEIMKWSILILTLVAGIVLGSLIGRPLVDRFVSIFGGADPNAGRGNQSVEADPETSAAFARFAEGHSGEARERLNAVLAANPKNAEAHFYMGRIDYTEGRYEDAINHYGEASKLNPGLPDIQIHLALAYLSIGQMRNARDTLQHVVSPGSAVSAPSPSMATSPTPETTGGVKPNG